MTKVTFYAPSKYARYVQDLVKLYDGRFKGNPCLLSTRAWFCISFKDSYKCNKFMIRVDILNQPWV